jgi:hypothetical protein
MKKNLLLVAPMLAFAFSAAAQPTITLDDITPEYGSEGVLVTTEYTDPGAGGANQTWDFSDLPMNSSSTNIVMMPDGQPGSENFPNATHVTMTEGTTQYSYNSYSNNKSEILGIIDPGQGFNYYYTNPRTQVETPLTFSSSYSDDYFRDDDLGFPGVTSTEEGTISTIIDGYGTLITPQGTFNDVLRFTETTESTVTTTLEGQDPTTQSFTGTTVGFFKAGFSFSLLSFTTFEFAGQTSNTAVYFGGQTTGVNDLPAGVNEVSVFPNPATETVNIQLSLQTGKTADIKIISLDGKTVAQIGARSISAGNVTELFNLPKLAPGMYMIQINLGTGVVNRKLLIE